MKEKLFLTVSKEVARRLTDTFDFVWPTATAIWNLRWQVQGFIAVNPQTTDTELAGRFVAGSGIRGSNLRRACITTTWDVQRQQFAKFLLIECCALYEAWCEGAMEELGCSQALGKHFQFPSSTSGKKQTGVKYALGTINSPASPAFSASLYPALLKNEKNTLQNLEDLLICYRFFKECRNAVIHRGGMATQRTADACNQYEQLTAAQLKAKEIPHHLSVLAGRPVELSLRGVVGFGDIILKLIATIDAELSRSIFAEDVFIKRWKATYRNNIRVLAGNRSRRHDQIVQAIRGLELPSPHSPAQLEPFLRKNGLVSSMTR
jgi:hypothetical protein